jgi:hypothetical protein
VKGVIRTRMKRATLVSPPPLLETYLHQRLLDRNLVMIPHLYLYELLEPYCSVLCYTLVSCNVALRCYAHYPASPHFDTAGRPTASPRLYSLQLSSVAFSALLRVVKGHKQGRQLSFSIQKTSCQLQSIKEIPEQYVASEPRAEFRLLTRQRACSWEVRELAAQRFAIRMVCTGGFYSSGYSFASVMACQTVSNVLKSSLGPVG